MKRSPLKNLPLIAAVALILIAGFAFYKAIVGVQNLQSIVVAKNNIAAYTAITSGMSDQYLTKKDVPSSSVTPNDLTWDEYQSKYAAKKKPLITVMQILANQRVQEQAVAKEDTASFAVVSSDERVVAVTSTVSGAGIGTIHAGDVVDVSQAGSTGDSTGSMVTFAKVLCVTVQPDGCKGVLPAGTQLAGASSKNTSSDSPVTILLAVPQDQAANLAGKSVALALNPFCAVNDAGYFVSTNDVKKFPDRACKAPAERAASNPPKAAPAGGSTTTSTTTTPTTPTTKTPTTTPTTKTTGTPSQGTTP